MTYVKTLIIDDHPFVAESYKKLIFDFFNEKSPETKFDFICSNSCKEAYEILEKKKINKSILDLVLLDLRIPSYPEKNILSGEDIGMYLKSHFPKTKIIVITSISNRFRILSILKEINPISFLLKSDLNHKDLISSIEKALRNEISRSQSVVKILENQLQSGDKFDDLDRKILFLLSKGESSINLSRLLPLSLSAIEKRKRKLARHFGLRTTSTAGILEAARKEDFL